MKSSLIRALTIAAVLATSYPVVAFADVGSTPSPLASHNAMSHGNAMSHSNATSHPSPKASP